MSGWGGRVVAVWAQVVVMVYGPTCHLCREPIDLRLPRRHPRGLSVDHVVPRSMGGADTLDNLRPAHLTCNTARGNRPIGATGRRPARTGSAFSDGPSAGSPAPSRIPPGT